MSSDIDEAAEGLENELWCRWSNGRVCRMSCDVGKAVKVLENELWCKWSDVRVGEWAKLTDIEIYSKDHCPTIPSLHLRHNSFSNPSAASSTSQLILQPFCCFTYITGHSTTLPLLHLHHRSFYNPSAASPKSQVILQPFHCFTYITGHSTTLLLLHLHHRSFYNPSVASPTSQALHVLHLVSRSCIGGWKKQSVVD